MCGQHLAECLRIEVPPEHDVDERGHRGCKGIRLVSFELQFC